MNGEHILFSICYSTGEPMKRTIFICSHIPDFFNEGKRADVILRKKHISHICKYKKYVQR